MDSRILADTITRRIQIEVSLPYARYLLARMIADPGSFINPELKAIREELEKTVKRMDKQLYPGDLEEVKIDFNSKEGRKNV